MLNAFKIKEFDLEPIFAEWTDGPIFKGNPKKDLPVDDWLDKIKEGCVARGVPEEYWYKVAQHFMGPKARARLDELKQVIVKVHGGKYRWSWKKFKLAMQNMGWTIDKDAKETIKVQGGGSGLWFQRKKDTETESIKSNQESEASKPRPVPSRSNSIWITKKPLVEEPAEEPTKEPSRRPTPSRSATSSGFWPNRMSTKDEKELPQRPSHQKSRSDTSVVRRGSKSRSPSRSHAKDGGEMVTTVTQAPVWLLNACTALDYITSEHPKAMSIISAILITAGSIPAIPAIAAGAGGAVLASGAAHAVGAIAVGLGQALSTTVKNAQKQEAQGSSKVH